MIAITKSPTKDKIDKNIIALIIVKGLNPGVISKVG